MSGHFKLTLQHKLLVSKQKRQAISNKATGAERSLLIDRPRPLSEWEAQSTFFTAILPSSDW
eukprot:2660442-Amphidinium_carterae.1